MIAAWALLAALLALGGVTASGADFVASSPAQGNTFAAAADFNTVAVTIADPGTPLRGTVALQATAGSDRGIDRVRFESSPAGAGTWTTACQDSAAPYGCDWATDGGANGARDVRAVAIDGAGYQRTAAVAARVVDNAAPVVTVDDPGPWLQGTPTIRATVSDAHSAVATVAIDYRPGGGGWTQLCAAAACPLPTTTLPDGDVELRARAVDTAGNQQVAAPIVRRVDNTAPTVSLALQPPARGTITVPIDAADGAGTGVARVTIEYRYQGGGGGTPGCTDTTAPFSCDLDTTEVPDGLYDARATAVDGTGLSTLSATIVGQRVDNTAPATATLTDPGALLEGAVALGGGASDAGAGIAAWTVQYRPAAGGAWSDACSDSASPYGCTWATTGVADGLYDLRSLARDGAGNETGSAVLTSRRVDNAGPAVALADPGSPIRGTVTLTATASDPAGVQSVVFERSVAEAGTWTTICTDTAPAYSCSFNTSALNGSSDLRARAVDAAGHSSTSVVAARVIDNTAPAGSAIATGNVSGGTAGRLEAGDWVRLMWTEAIAPASVLAGWTGGSRAIVVRVANNGSNDRMDFYDAANTTRLNLVNGATDLQLGGNFVTGATVFDATMTASGASVTVTLGARRSGTVSTAGNGTMTWLPSAGATDLAGNPSATTQVTEPAPSDRDF